MNVASGPFWNRESPCLEDHQFCGEYIPIVVSLLAKLSPMRRYHRACGQRCGLSTDWPRQLRALRAVQRTASTIVVPIAEELAATGGDRRATGNSGKTVEISPEMFRIRFALFSLYIFKAP